MKFSDLQVEAKKLNETRDCGVKALAVVTGISYSEAHAILKRNGRIDRDGTPNAITRKCLRLLGYKTEVVAVKARTVRTLEREINDPYNTYLVWVSCGRHILGMRNGKVVDWTKNRLHRIHKIERVVYVGTERLAASNK